jgi:hypothetical protein
MRRILKFPLGVLTQIETADEPRWLSAGWQGDQLVAWCEATPGSGVIRTVAAISTGDASPTVFDNARFIGTAMHPTMLGGAPLVVHVYAQES